MHAASRHGTPSLASLPKDGEVSCEVSPRVSSFVVLKISTFDINCIFLKLQAHRKDSCGLILLFLRGPCTQGSQTQSFCDFGLKIGSPTVARQIFTCICCVVVCSQLMRFAICFLHSIASKS